VEDTIDPKTGIPVYSLYGKKREMFASMMKDIDVLVYDIQDIGCRSYTFISTMGQAMQTAAENNLEFVVLDRPNPLGGEKVEGNLVEQPICQSVWVIPFHSRFLLHPGSMGRIFQNE
jgi:uncharacterized protein YbbC (DUF1343 family)